MQLSLKIFLFALSAIALVGCAAKPLQKTDHEQTATSDRAPSSEEFLAEFNTAAAGVYNFTNGNGNCPRVIEIGMAQAKPDQPPELNVNLDQRGMTMFAGRESGRIRLSRLKEKGDQALIQRSELWNIFFQKDSKIQYVKESGFAGIETNLANCMYVKAQ